jgi:hypothetical protein
MSDFPQRKTAARGWLRSQREFRRRGRALAPCALGTLDARVCRAIMVAHPALGVATTSSIMPKIPKNDCNGGAPSEPAQLTPSRSSPKHCGGYATWSIELPLVHNNNATEKGHP